MPTNGWPREMSAWSASVFWLSGAMIVVLLLAVWMALPALLLAFAAAIFASILSAAARPLVRYIGLPRGLALPVAGLVLLAVPVTGVVLIGPELRGQLGELAKAVPDAISALEAQLGIRFETLLKEATGTGQTANGSRGLISDAINIGQIALSNLSTAGGFILNALAGLIVVVVGGFFLATDPDRYFRGIVRLVPKDQQGKLARALGNCGRALEQWLRAQLVAMIVVGMLTGGGAWLIGLPAPLAIGVIAGVLEFFPIIGPWLAAIPVLLLAFGQGPQVILFAALLLLLVQQLESNVITPLAQQSMAKIPPFVVLFGLIAFGLMFGWIGVIAAGPLTLVAYVLISELYVKDALGQQIEVPGAPKPGEPAASHGAEASP